MSFWINYSIMEEEGFFTHCCSFFSSKTFSSIFSTGSNQDKFQPLIMSQIKAKFPNASKYYLKDEAEVWEEEKCLQQLENYLVSKTKFYDQQYPKTQKGKYKEAAEIFDGNRYELFKNQEKDTTNMILDNEIKESKLDTKMKMDYYFQACIAYLLFADSSLIYDKFIFRDNDAGLYAVKLFWNGQWHYIITDDRFPCENNELVYAKPKGKNEIFIMLLEKCWAKLFGSYKTSTKGKISQAFIALTGAPAFQFETNTKNKQQSQTLTQNSQLNNLLKTVYIKISYNGPTYIPRDNFFAIPKIFENRQRDVLYIEIENPWRYVFKKKKYLLLDSKIRESGGVSHQKSEKQQQEYKRILPMEQDHVRRIFKYFTICYYNPGFSLSSFKLKEEQIKEQVNLNVEVKTNGTYFFSVYQKNKQCYTEIAYEYSKISMKIKELQTSNKMNFLEKDNCSTLKCNLAQAGQYKISIKVCWNTGPFPIMFSSYGVGPVNIFKIMNQQNRMRKDI